VQHVEVPVPVPAKDQVLVKVEAASVNPVEWKVIQAGLFKLFLPAKLPHIPGAAGYFIRHICQSEFVE
jgi:NADPH:quinone reductase-like Zn-dependent oxidoreductase